MKNKYAELRHKAGLTQRLWAEKLGVTITTVSAWECGRFEPSRKKEREMMAIVGEITG